MTVRTRPAEASSESNAQSGVPEISISRDRVSAPATEIRAAPSAVSSGHALSEEEFIFWFANKRRQSQHYHVLSFGFEVAGPFSECHLESAISETVRNAPVLQSRIVDDGLTAYRCHDNRHDALAIAELPDDPWGEGSGGPAFDAVLRRPFDVGRAPQIEVFRSRRERSVVYAFRAPHLSFDGQSVNIFLNEVIDRYGAAMADVPFAAKVVPADRRPQAQAGEIEAHTAQVVAQMGSSKAASLARSHRPDEEVRWTRTCNARLPRALGEALRAFARKHNTPLFTVMAAVTTLMLSRYLDEDDVTVGLPVSLRDRATRNTMGCMVKTLPLSVRGIDGLTFEQLVAVLRNGVISCQSHKSASLLEIARRAGQGGDSHPGSLWTAVIASQGQMKPEIASAGAIFKPLYLGGEATENELMFDVREIADEVEVDCHFRADLFPMDHVQRMVANLVAMGLEAVARPQVRTSELSLLDPTERQLVEQVWSGRERLPRQPLAPIEELFAEVVRRRGDAVALEHGRDTFTYDHLDRWTNRLARRLILEGCVPERPVVVLEEDPAQALMFMLACLKAGIPYVPVDSAAPQARIELILGESSASHLLTDRAPSDWPSHRVLSSSALRLEDCSDAKLDMPIPLSRTAYIIFTSGSTGTPKGVAIRRESIPHVMLAAGGLDILPDDRVMHLCSRAFDLSVAEIYGTLFNGATLVLVDDRQRQRIDVLAERVAALRISVLVAPTHVFNELVHRFLSSMTGLRRVFFIGEKASATHVRRAVEALPNTQLVNSYGPTEATVFATVHEIRRVEEDGRDIPVGTPVPGQVILVLDRNGRPCPIEVEGEIHIGGLALMSGYWQRDDLTRACMVEDTSRLAERGRLYKSGDFGYWDRQGSLHVTGRKDSQRKIRGFRVELDEIRRAIINTGCVEDALVRIETRENRAEAVAYLKASDRMKASTSEAGARQIGARLKKILPDYMVPSRYFFVDDWRMTLNGKLDEARIVSQCLQADAVTPSRDSPPEPAGHGPRLAGIWKRILHVSALGPASDFFQLGGNSLSAIDLCVAINTEFNISVNFHVVYDHSDFDRQLNKIEQALADADAGK